MSALTLVTAAAVLVLLAAYVLARRLATPALVVDRAAHQRAQAEWATYRQKQGVAR